MAINSNSSSNMTDGEIVAFVIAQWMNMANHGADEKLLEVDLAWIKTNGLYAWMKLLRDHPRAVAFRALRDPGNTLPPVEI